MTAPTPSPEIPADIRALIEAERDALLAPLREEAERVATAWTKRIDAAESEVARLRETLAFYANPDTYHSPSSGFALQYDPMPKPIEIDHGGRAARALAEGGKEPPQKL